MQLKEKKKINLGKNNQTIHLIYNYRILKYWERVSHRDKSFEDLEQELLKKCKNDSVLLRCRFILSALNNESSPIRHTDEFCHSYELNEQSTYYRILEERNELEEAIAELSYVQMYPNKRPSRKAIAELAAHLRNYIGNYEIMKEYKEYIIEKEIKEGKLERVPPFK